MRSLPLDAQPTFGLLSVTRLLNFRSVLFICVAAGLSDLLAWTTYHFASLDLGGPDETLYMTAAFAKIRMPTWAPIYSLYYRIFAALSSDPIAVYYSARLFLLCIAFPIAVFFAARAITGDKKFAAVCALIMPVLAMFMASDPGVQLFNLIIWMILLSLLVYGRKHLLVAIALAASLACLPFIRQDNSIYIASYLVALIWSDSWSGLKRARTLILLGTAFTATYLGLQYLLGGSPFEGARALYAFADHYFWNHRAQILPIANVARQDLVIRYFGNPGSLSQLLTQHASELAPYFAHQAYEFLKAFRDRLDVAALLLAGLAFVIGSARLRKSRGLNDPASRWALLVFITFAKAFLLCTLLNSIANYYLEAYAACLFAAAWLLYQKATERGPIAMIFAGLLVSVYGYQNSPRITPVTLLGTVLEVRDVVTSKMNLSMAHVLGTERTNTFVNRNSSEFRFSSFFVPAARVFASSNFLDLATSSGVDVVVIDRDFRALAEEYGLEPFVSEFENNWVRAGRPMPVILANQTRIYFIR